MSTTPWIGGRAVELVTEIAELSARSTSTIKRLINLGPQADLGTGLRIEAVTNRFGRENLFADSEGVSTAGFRTE